MQTGRSFAAHFEDDASREAYLMWSAAQMLVYNAKVDESNYFWRFRCKFWSPEPLPKPDQKYAHLVNPDTVPWVKEVPSAVRGIGAYRFYQAMTRFLRGLSKLAHRKPIRNAVMTFEDWLPQVWLPEVQPLDGRRISEMLSNITQLQLERYYKLRYDRACKHSDSPVTLSFDSTSISTYSNTINAAAWGHAKQNPELRQVNYMTVCDHATGDVVFACSYDGSINDQTILPEIYLRMKFAGLDLTNNILVTDRGFQSIYNTQTAINLNLKYIQFLSLKEGAVKAHLQRHKQALCDSIAHKDPVLGISAIAVPDEW